MKQEIRKLADMPAEGAIVVPFFGRDEGDGPFCIRGEQP